jgi:hypothetical protein
MTYCPAPAPRDEPAHAVAVEGREWTDGILSLAPLHSCGHFRRSRTVQPIRLRRHDEIVAMQALDFVRPPGYGDFAPFGQNRGMMSLLLRDFRNLVCERAGLGDF